jgi:YjbR
MVSIETFRKLALSFPRVEEKPHFHLRSFRVRGKIFATLWRKEKRAMLKLSLVDQSVFCSYDKGVFFPAPGGWGTKGAIFVELAKVRKAMFKDVLTSAYELASLKKRSHGHGGH